MVWDAVRAEPLRRLQVQVVQARPRAPGQPERRLHSRIAQGPVREDLDRQRSAVDRLRPSNRDIYSLSCRSGTRKLSAGVTHISEDHVGMVWVATADGLRRLDPVTGRITEYRHDPNNPASLSSNTIRSSGEDKPGTFWVTTREQGLDAGLTAIPAKSLACPVARSQDVRFHEDRSGVFWLIYIIWQRAGRA